MRELANLMHMSLSTIYQLGGSKDQLIAEAHADRMAKFREALHRKPPRGATAEDRVRNVLRQYVSTLDRDTRANADDDASVLRVDSGRAGEPSVGAPYLRRSH